MERIVKVKLEDLTTFFVRFNHCDTMQMVMKDELINCDEFTCCKCEEPLMLRGSNGLWYYLKGRVFE